MTIGQESDGATDEPQLVPLISINLMPPPVAPRLTVTTEGEALEVVEQLIGSRFVERSGTSGRVPKGDRKKLSLPPTSLNRFINSPS